MCIAKLDYEVSIVGYKDFTPANILTSLLVKFLLRHIDGKTHLSGSFYGIMPYSFPVEKVTGKQFPIERKGNSYVGLQEADA